jgi:Tfp pilus assembly protein PilP
MMKSILSLMSVLMLVVLVGCVKQEEEVLNAPTVNDYAKIRAASAAKIKESPGQKAGAQQQQVVQREEGDPEEADFGSGDGFRYDPTGRRDPFRSFIVETLAQSDSDKTRGPLEYFELSQLKLVAVIVSQENPHALVYDPSGKGYIVSVGTKIGKREGHIVAMSQSSMTVQETQEDVYGDMTARNIEMKIRHSEGG